MPLYTELNSNLNVLDVGCGSKPHGTVNCDLYIDDIQGHRGDKLLFVKSLPNFVNCDGRYLPFVDGCFDAVFSGQLIEHLENPVAFIKELSRVCKVGGIVTIETVHRLGERMHSQMYRKTKWFSEHHISQFNFSWFASAAPVAGCKLIDSYVISNASFPHHYIALIKFPYEIGVKMTKVKQIKK